MSFVDRFVTGFFHESAVFFGHSSFFFITSDLFEKGVHFSVLFSIHVFTGNHIFFVFGLISVVTHVNPEFKPIDELSRFIEKSGLEDQVSFVLRISNSRRSGIDGIGIRSFNSHGDGLIEKIELTDVKGNHIGIGRDSGFLFFFIILSSSSFSNGKSMVVVFSLSFFVGSSSCSFFGHSSPSFKPDFFKVSSFNS